MVKSLIGALLFVFFSIIYFVFNPRKRPLHTESDLRTATFPWFYLYYSSKYLSSVRYPRKDTAYKDLFRDTTIPQDSRQLKCVSEVVLKAVGDLMVRKEFETEKNSKLWDEISEYLFDADLTFANLEFAINPDWIIEKTIRYSVPVERAKSLLFADVNRKFDVVATANNHINDSLSAGIVSTCESLDAMGIAHTGSSKTKDEQNEFPVFTVNSIKIAFLAYTFSTNGIPLENHFQFGTNVVHFNALNDHDYDPSLIHHHIDLARKQGVDIIVSSFHWGVEFEYYPPDRLIKRGHELMDAGIDVILGHHPHILCQSQWYKTTDGRRALCFYSLGHFTKFAQLGPIKSRAAIAKITFEKGEDTEGKSVVRIKDAEITPTYFRRKLRKGGHDHRILPLLAYAAKIKSKQKLPFLSFLDKVKILYSAYDFNRYLKQSGFKYR